MDAERLLDIRILVGLGALPPSRLVSATYEFDLEQQIEKENPHLPDDYGIEYADTERLVHTPWACGFVDVKGGII